MTLHTYPDIEQGTPEWHDLRRGIVTASTVGQLVTAKTIKVASNDYSRGLTASLVAERITGYTEPVYASADMERGKLDEPIAREIYSENYSPVTEVGFMVREDNGHRLGYSPDGLVGDDGLIEIKSRRGKKQLSTILDGRLPLENAAQCQAGLYVSGRDWLDFISYSGGMPLWVCRVRPDERWFAAIREALDLFEETAERMIGLYETATTSLIPTERVEHFADLDLVS